MENLNRVLLENVLPAHVAEHFLARSLKNEVRRTGADGREGAGGWPSAGRSGQCRRRPWPSKRLRVQVQYQPEGSSPVSA